MVYRLIATRKKMNQNGIGVMKTQTGQANKTIAKVSFAKYINTDAKDEKKMPQGNPDKYETIEEPPYKMIIKWPYVFVTIMMHLGFLYALYLIFFEAKFSTFAFGLSISYVYGVTITMGAHRLYSHRSFKTNKYIRFVLILLQTMTGQRSMFTWVRDHRMHHKFSETNADPHNSNRGFFFCHVGWILVHKHPDVMKKADKIDMSDLTRDPIVMFQKKYYSEMFAIFGVILPTSIPCLLWNETIWNSFFVCVVGVIPFVWHHTWSINSIAHKYGNKPYNKNIAAGENPIVSFFCLGEGNHNYHHMFPWDYRTAENPYYHLTTKVIDFCLKKGWAYDAKTASRELIKQQAEKEGDGSLLTYRKLNPNGIPVSENYTYK